MHSIIIENFDHYLCGMLFLARCGDILTTWLATPTMRLEANPIAKKLGWVFAVATIFTCFTAYVSQPLALALLGISLCVCASNASKLWMLRTLGEEEYLALQVATLRRSGLTKALIYNCSPALFYIALGLIMRFVDGDPITWGYHLGTGVFAFGIAILVFYPRKYYRLYKESLTAS